MTAAPFDPTAWSAAMATIAELTDACSVQWAGWVGEHIPSVMMLNVDDAIFTDWLAAGGATLANPLIAASLTSRIMSSIASDEVVSDHVRRHSDLWAYVHPKYDMPHVCSGKVWARDSNLLTLNVMRTRRQGGVEPERRRAFDAALVSANRAVQLARVIGEDGARLLVSGLEAVKAAAFVLDGFGRVIAASAKTPEHLAADRGLRLANGRLNAREAGNDAQLQAAIGAAVRRYPVTAQASRQVFIRREAPGPATLLTLTPLPERLGLPVMGASALVVAQSTLAHLLTPAERAVLAFLIEGRAVTEIASARGSALETVRSQIKSIHAKAGVSSRGELLALYARGELSL